MLSIAQPPISKIVKIVKSQNIKKNMGSAKYNHRTAILESKFEGNITIEELIESSLAIKENKSYPRFLKILIDFKKAFANFHSNDLTLLAEEYLKVIEKYDFIIMAIILDTPKETAFAMLFQSLIKDNTSKYQVFSTREAAISWLNNYTESNCKSVKNYI
ncbi:MAG TPA: STAS/SEC14 domain-containing protein [Lutibacter sp.]